MAWIESAPLFESYATGVGFLLWGLGGFIAGYRAGKKPPNPPPPVAEE